LYNFDTLPDFDPTVEAPPIHQSYLSLFDETFSFETQLFSNQMSFPETEPGYSAAAGAAELPWRSAGNEAGFLAEQHQSDARVSTSSDFVTAIAESREHSQAPFAVIAAPKDICSSALNHDMSLSVAHEQEIPANDEMSQHNTSANGADSASSIAQRQAFHCDYVGCEALTFNCQSHLK
jgi:hypothetical protein